MALHDLVRNYGHRAVWAVGLKTLKYPPTWATWGTEVQQLRIALAPYPTLQST